MIDQTAFNRLQEFALAVFGPFAQYLFVVYAAAIVALIMLMLALALLRRMLNP
jgi:heme exporter protein D